MQESDVSPFSSPEEAIELIERSEQIKESVKPNSKLAALIALASAFSMPNPKPGAIKSKNYGSKKGYKAPEGTRKAVARRKDPIMTNNERVVWGRCVRRGLTVMQYRERFPKTK